MKNKIVVFIPLLFIVGFGLVKILQNVKSMNLESKTPVYIGYYSNTQNYIAFNSDKKTETDYDGADELKIYKDDKGITMLELKRTMENYHMCNLGPTPVIFKTENEFEAHSFLEEEYLEAVNEYEGNQSEAESFVNPYLPEEERKNVTLDESTAKAAPKDQKTPRPEKDWFKCVLVFKHEGDAISFYKDEERSLSMACASLCGARAYFPEKDRAITLKLDPHVPLDIEVVPR